MTARISRLTSMSLCADASCGDTRPAETFKCWLEGAKGGVLGRRPADDLAATTAAAEEFNELATVCCV